MVAISLFIVGDGSGGGGGAGYSIVGGNGGDGGGGSDHLAGDSYNDVIFGDGSGGGGGYGYWGGGTGGLGGGGNDGIFGYGGNDILFGDGFNGQGGGGIYAAAGGLGGGGGGGGGHSYTYRWYWDGGVGGIGGGSGNRDYFGDNSITTYQSTYANGGVGFVGISGGGGGFGDIGNGGAGGYTNGYNGAAGGTNQYSTFQYGTSSSIYNNLITHVTAGDIYKMPGTNNGYGGGNDILDGGAGSDHYFGMGGADTFVVSAQDNAGTDVDTIWDFKNSDGDKIQLENGSGNILSSAELDNLLNPANAYINITGSDTTINMPGGGSTLVIKGVTDLTAADFLVACFLPGTQFETADGMKAIEELQRGDMLKTADGYAPLKWLAHRHVDWSMSIPRRIAPVLVKQGALGNGLPLRDLYVSPAHAFEIDGVLINAELLINGSTIVQLLDYDRDFTWYNIELESHSIVYAEGAAVESYLEVGDNRNSYDNAAEFHALYPHHVVPQPMEMGRITLKRQLPSLRKAAA